MPSTPFLRIAVERTSSVTHRETGFSRRSFLLAGRGRARALRLRRSGRGLVAPIVTHTCKISLSNCFFRDCLSGGLERATALFQLVEYRQCVTAITAARTPPIHAPARQS